MLCRPIGGDAIEARRHVPPQILAPGGTLWIVPPPILASSFVIILALTSLSLAYCTEGTFAIHFATEAIYCIAHKATGGRRRLYETAVFTQRQRLNYNVSASSSSSSDD